MFEIHIGVPEPIFLILKEHGRTLFTLYVEFEVDLSNVLTVVTKLILQDSTNTCTAAKIKYDLNFLVSLYQSLILMTFTIII